MRRVLPLLLAAVALSSCGGSAQPRGTLVVVVNAPFSRTPYLGRAIEDGARLAAEEVNATGVRVGNRLYDVRIETLDSALSPARAVANVRRAVGRHAVAIVDEGTGVDASWRIADHSGTAIGVVFEGGEGIVDPEKRKNVFRVAPTDHGVAFRLAENLVPKRLKLALVHDDSDCGAAGAAVLRRAFSGNRSSVAIDETVPADALDLGPQLLRARQAHATAVLVWGRPATIAAAITAARSSAWNVPFFTPPSGGDPFVRQQLADHPAWVDGLTFASGRLTAEVGTGPFHPARITAALEQVSVEGANGDSRGFNEHNHEGVVDDDVYFARFHDMTYTPVKDDPLSSTLPTVPQTR